MKLFFTHLLTICIFFAASDKNYAQEKKSPFKRKRQKVELSNYYIALNTNDALSHFSGKIEWKIDQLKENEEDKAIKNNLTFLKFTTTNAIAKTTFHTDPLVGALDTWALAYQIENYLNQESAKVKYGKYIHELAQIFVDYRNEYEQDFNKYISPESIEELKTFSKNNPIEDDNLNRKSVSPHLSEWLGDEALGFKSGLLTMTDLVRDMSNRMEYYTEMLPKQTKWQMEFEIGEFLSEDSLGTFLNNVSNTLTETSQFLENTESLINYNRDTILANIDYQRIATMRAIRNERIETLKTLAMEREIILAAMQQERLAVQEFASSERQAMMADMEKISQRMMENSTSIAKELIDYVFWKIIMVTVILGFTLIVMTIIYKKM